MLSSSIYPVFIMISLSALFGCKSNSLFGPDFNNSIEKNIEIEPGITVSYRVPGNLSKMLNFAERYAKESPNTIRVRLNDALECDSWHWRRSCQVDGAMWDYKAKGDISLNLRIELMPVESASDAETAIKELYEKFLNGANGINTAVRNRNPGIPDEDLVHWIRPIPNDFSWNVVGYKRTLSWSEGSDDRGKYTRYYSFVIAEDMLLNFVFMYTTSSHNAKERERAKEQIPDDIASFMQHVEVRR